jgi:hypothetical protein
VLLLQQQKQRQQQAAVALVPKLLELAALDLQHWKKKLKVA